MGKKKEVIFDAVGFPVAGGTTIMLFFENDFLELKTGIKEDLHGLETEWDNVAFLAHITDKNGAEIAGFEDTKAFGGDWLKLFEEIGVFEVGKVGGNVLTFAVVDNVGVGWVSTDKIDSRIRYGIKVTSVAESEIDVSGGVRMLEVGFLLTASDGNRVDINADDISSEEFGLNEGGATSGKLVQNEISAL